MDEQKDKYIEHLISAVVLLVLIVGCFFVLRPFISALLWALILSFSTWPVYQWWVKRLKGRKTLAATIMTLLLTATFVVPILFIALRFAGEAADLVARMRAAFEQGLPPLPPWVEHLPIVGNSLYESWEDWTIDPAQFEDELEPYLKQIRQFILKSTPGMALALFQILLSVVVCFFLLP